jgi:hypothetical protein
MERTESKTMKNNSEPAAANKLDLNKLATRGRKNITGYWLTGKSWIDGITAGSIVVAETERTPKKGDAVLYCEADGTINAKRFEHSSYLINDGSAGDQKGKEFDADGEILGVIQAAMSLFACLVFLLSGA